MGPRSPQRVPALHPSQVQGADMGGEDWKIREDSHDPEREDIIEKQKWEEC